MHCANNQIDLLLLLQSPAACAAVEKRAKEIAESLEAEYWSVSAKTGEFIISSSMYKYISFSAIVILRSKQLIIA